MRETQQHDDQPGGRAPGGGAGAKMTVALVTLLLAVLVAAIPAGANERVAFPEESPGPPFYARIVNDDDTAAVVFYRDPACVPTDFNLLRLFDVPRAFGCALTVEGFEVYENGPPPEDPAPIHAELRGTAVPVWFVSVDELRAAVADGVLTIGELAAMPSLVTGTADRYTEVIHPSPTANKVKLTMNALGALADGTPFQVHVSLNERPESDRYADPVWCACDINGYVTIKFR